MPITDPSRELLGSDLIRGSWVLPVIAALASLPLIIDLNTAPALDLGDSNDALAVVARPIDPVADSPGTAPTDSAEPRSSRAATPAAVRLASQEVGTRLDGTTGKYSGRRWSSAALDLNSVMDFSRGDRLEIQVGGSATTILVRLLPRGAGPNLRIGVVGGDRTVPKSRRVVVQLGSDRNRIEQISVHGGAEAWGVPFPRGNGSVTLEQVNLIRASSTD